MKRFISWLRPSFEDNTGKASYRRITAFVFVWLICYMVLGAKITTELAYKVFLTLLATLMLLIGIVTTQNLLTFFNKNSKNDHDEVKED